jgi:hypothetical protein
VGGFPLDLMAEGWGVVPMAGDRGKSVLASSANIPS